MARAGGFSRSLRPFGGGALNIDDAYRIEAPKETATPPTPNPPPPRVAGGATPSVPTPKPPIVGKVPVPRTTVKKAPVKAVKKPAAKKAPVKATKKPVIKKPPVAKTREAGSLRHGRVPKPPARKPRFLTAAQKSIYMKRNA